jgi:cytochrome bd ubiquinol oxidase subunit II
MFGFSLLTGVGLLVAYALLGVTWLVMKTEGMLQNRMRTLGRPITIALLAVIAIVSLWTPYAHADVAARWFSLPNLHGAPFVLALLLLFLGYTGLAISLWPNIIPPGISIWDAAAPAQSMGFTLVGTLFIIPFILAYTAWSYYVFRGKVRPGQGYH